MTKTEAINILELYNPFLGGDDYKLLSEAMDIAVKALKSQSEQHEIIRCEDCLHGKGDIFDRGMWCELRPEYDVVETDFCSKAERRTDE